MRGSTGQLDKEATVWHILRSVATLTASATPTKMNTARAATNGRPRSKGAAPSGSADLMQNLPRISKQFQPMQRIPTKKPIVQKPCIDRASPDFSGLHNKKERQILRFDVQYLVHLQGLEPWAH